MDVLGYTVEKLGSAEFDYNYKLQKANKTIYLIRSLGKLLPVSEDGKCGKIKGVQYFTDTNGVLAPVE